MEETAGSLADRATPGWRPPEPDKASAERHAIKPIITYRRARRRELARIRILVLDPGAAEIWPQGCAVARWLSWVGEYYGRELPTGTL